MGKKVTSNIKDGAGDGVPRHDTPAKPITPPSNHRHDVLPLSDIGSVALEKMCRDTISYGFPAIASAALKRDRGQSQFGVDVEGFDTGQRSTVVISAKCYQEVKARYLLAWTRDFTKHLDGHWKDKGITHFVLAISVCRNNDDLNEAVRSCVAECAAHGIKFVLWDALLITDLLREEPTLVDRYFNEYWVKTISPKRSPESAITSSAANSGATSAAILQLSLELVEIARQRDTAIAERLEAAQREFRAGRHSDLVQWFTDLRANEGLWGGLNATIRAKATRARAMVALHLGQIPQARAFLDEADAFAASPDRAPRVFLTRAEKTAGAALQLLEAPSSPRENEVKASLLLELGRINEAFGVLDGLPSPPSAEQIRIRAIAQCLAGEREAAVATAIAAREKEPTSASIQQTLAALHVAAATSDRAEPQFGSVPNPFNLGLVKRTKGAQEHLASAVAIFDTLLPTVEPLLRSDFEVWKLAVLVMLREKREEARKLSAELLARPAPEPLAIVWSRLAAMPVRLGKLRKSLEDQLRKGKGSPTHVVVSALLAADTNGDKAGANVITQHLDKFPEANNFLEGWRQRLAGETTGDPYADAMQTAVESRNYAPLIDFISSDKATGGDILNAAQMLRARGEWLTVRALEPQLLSVETPRAIELAAAAAVRTSHPADAIRIIDESADLFPDGRLPAGIQYLRSQAHDALGLKHKAISDLEAAALASNDPRLRLELAQSYIGIGNLTTGKQHAEVYLKSPGAKAGALIEVAQALKRAHPAFARELVVKAAADPKLPKSLAPTVLVLATEMGNKDIERQMLEIVTNIERHGKATKVQALTFEELLAFVKGRDETLRRRFSDWIDGKTPSHVFLQGDLDRFAKLFLGIDEDRIDPAGERFPLLVRSGYLVVPPSALDGAKPALRLDISALMLASRLGLIDSIDAAFQVMVPSSLPLSLVDMDASLPVPSQDVIAACKNALDRTSALLEIGSVPPPEAASLADPDEPTKLSESALSAVLKLSVEKGIISQQQRMGALASFGMPMESATCLAPPEAVLLTPAMAVALATSKILEAIAQTLPTHISCDDHARLGRDIADAERAVSRSTTIGALRDLVASRVESGVWHLLPKAQTAPHKNGHPLRAHTASLVEILEAAAQPSDGLFWIEDRAIQRGRHPQIVSVVEILELLQRRNAISPARRQTAIEALRSWGYGYLSPDAGEFATKLLAAPVQANSVVETAELRAIRGWYAQEVDRLRHLDFQPQRDQDGKVVGEARHALDVLGVVIDVFRNIWNSSIPTKEKQARSVWAWTCLRVEQTDFLPRNNRNSEGRHAVVASTLAQIAMLPFLSSAEKNPLAHAARQPFATWFFHGVLVPRCGYDPRLQDQVQDFIAGHLAALFNLSFEDVSSDDARAYFAEQVNSYLNLLPKSWQDGITGRHGLSEKLGLRTILVVRAGPAEIATEELHKAIVQGIAKLDQEDSVTTALTGIDGATVQVTLRKTSGPLPLVELRCQHEKIDLDPPYVALAHPAQVTRLATLPTMSNALDGSANAKREVLEAIAREDDGLERSRLFHALISKNFARRLRKITDQSRKGSVDLEDLALPGPEVLAMHLGLDNVAVQSARAFPHRPRRSSPPFLRCGLPVVARACRSICLQIFSTRSARVWLRSAPRSRAPGRAHRRRCMRFSFFAPW